MKSFLPSAVFLVFTLFAMVSYGQENHSNDKTQETATYVENEIIIWLEQDVDAATFSINSKAGIFPKRLLSKRLNIWLFEIEESKVPREERMQRLTRNADVRLIQNNHTNIVLRESIPDDPDYEYQWAPEVMELPHAWERFGTDGVTSTGDTIVVAVIDGGADLSHEDMHFWKNLHEIPNNGIDDDDNGYIDDFDGWNAYSHNGNITCHHHGTHVAGILGAIGNNGKGICGVNWNVRVMPISGSTSNESVVVEAYSYALEMRARYNETNGEEGAFIVATNSSFGVDNGNPDNYPIWCAMYDEMGAVGILSCGAGPNKNVSVDEVGDVPSTCPGNYLIGVTNTNSADEKFGSAGYGITNIDIGAPGTNIYSTIPYNEYNSLTGTSMATPQVSGTIALMYAAMPQEMMQVCKNNPAEFCLSVRKSLLEGADHLSSLDGLVAYGRRLNAFGAIERALFGAIKPIIVGDVKIMGEPIFGQTLTVEAELSTSPSIPDLGEWSYQWRKDATDIDGAVYSTYTLTEADVNEKISVKVTTENSIGTITSVEVGPVMKAEQAPPEAPQLKINTETSITLAATEGCEYNIDEGAWQSSPIFEGLTPNTTYVFAQRKKETNSHNASPMSSEAVFCTVLFDQFENDCSNAFSIYPNPTKGCVTIKGSGQLSITNVLGQAILAKEIHGLETFELKKGKYYVKLNNEVRKVVVE